MVMAWSVGEHQAPISTAGVLRGLRSVLFIHLKNRHTNIKAEHTEKCFMGNFVTITQNT